jgi:hypothetical protein
MAKLGGSPHHRSTRADRFMAISEFSDLWTAERKDLFAVQFQYNIATDDVVVDTEASGTVTQGDSMATLQTGTGDFAYADIHSKKSLRYLPGHEAAVHFTALFTASGTPGRQVGVAGTKQYCGVFTDLDGYFMGFDGEQFFVARRKGGQDFQTFQADFNQDKLDGVGKSLYGIDLSKLNVFRIRFGWLGAAVISFEVMRPAGDWLEFHRLITPGMLDAPTSGNPVLPMRFFTDNNDTGQNIIMRTASWNGAILGGDFASADRHKSFGNSKTVLAGVLTSIFQIRSAEEFHGQINRVLTELCFISGATDAAQLARIRILKGSTVTGESFTPIDPVNSVLSIDTAGVQVTEIGTEVFTFGVTRQSSEAFSILDMHLHIEPGEKLTFAILQPADGMSLGSLRTCEFF